MYLDKTSINKIIKESGFKAEKEIYRSYYYSATRIRNVIYSGIYKGNPAVIKIYDDPRMTCEPRALATFHKTNKSKILTAPKLYKQKVMSGNSGWFIAEMIPDGFKKFSTPLEKSERAEFIELFKEYRSNFSKLPTRRLYLPENLTPGNYHIYRIGRWLELASNKENTFGTGKSNPNLIDAGFMKDLESSFSLIRKEFKNRRMVWCHGLFNPNEIFTDKDRTKYYLIDFAHVGLFPEGYELALMAWADHLMIAKKWNEPFDKWKTGAYEWMGELENLAGEMKFRNPKKLIRASLVERLIGTILADIGASDRPYLEKKKGIGLMTSLLKELLK